MGAVDSGDIVHAADDEVVTIGRPRKVIDLGTARTTHVLSSP